MSGPIKVVAALGGNALEDKALPPTAQSQRAVAARTARQLARMSAQGYELAIVHGNGPQVGRIVLAGETAADVTPPMPFDVCGAMSQGYIGYHLQQALTEELRRAGRDVPVVSLVTQMVVNPDDPAFQNPTKPIGPFYTREQAAALERERGYVMREDSGRGWRRVVPSRCALWKSAPSGRFGAPPSPSPAGAAASRWWSGPTAPWRGWRR